MLKMMENLGDRHIMDEILGLHPLDQYQFAYQREQSTEVTLDYVITHVEEAVENTKVILGAFLDIEGALEYTSFDIITKAAKQYGHGRMTSQWISSMLDRTKSHPHLQEKFWRRHWPGPVCSRAFYHLWYGAWLWMNS
jgi:hypothetical protein